MSVPESLVALPYSAWKENERINPTDAQARAAWENPKSRRKSTGKNED
jgi:hypothetical protein